MWWSHTQNKTVTQICTDIMTFHYFFVLLRPDNKRQFMAKTIFVDYCIIVQFRYHFPQNCWDIKQAFSLVFYNKLVILSKKSFDSLLIQQSLEVTRLQKESLCLRILNPTDQRPNFKQSLLRNVHKFNKTFYLVNLEHDLTIKIFVDLEVACYL